MERGFISRYSISLLLVGLLLLPRFALAGAWTQEQGTHQLITTLYYYETSELFAPGGRRTAQPRFGKWELNPYWEYGYRDDLTLGLSGFAQYLEQKDASGDTATNIGLAETELFARYRFYQQDRLVASVQPLVKLPSIYRDGSGPKAGRNDYDTELALLGGYGFPLAGQEHYASVKAAYRRRFGRLGDQWKLEAELGLRLSPIWMLRPQLTMIREASGSGDNLISVSGQNNFDLTKTQLSAVWQMNETYALEAGGFRHINGDNTGAGGGVLTSLWVRW